MRMQLQGMKFNMLTVIKRAEQTKKVDSTTWECLCDCGNTTYATTSELRGGHKKSCGCLKRQPHGENLKGQRFGRLTVQYRFGYDEKTRKALWRCKCDCGKYTTVRSSDLKSSNTKSCGCLGKNYGKRNILDY